MERSDILKRFQPKKENLLPILHELQKNSKGQFISAEDMSEVADYLNISYSSVYGAVTYYSMFSLKPRGRYLIRICVSPVCDMTGSDGVIRELTRRLGIGPGETTADNLFTIESCECLGRCGESPGMLVNEEFYGNLSPENIGEVIAHLKSREI